MIDDDRPTLPDPYAIHELPTVPRAFAPLRFDTSSDAFFAAGVAIERSHQRRAQLLRFVAFVSLVCTAVTLAAVALEWMRVRGG